MKKFLAAVAAVLMAAHAQAALFSFGNEFSGGTDCSNAATGCATLEVTQQGGNVHFVLTGTMVGTEFITSIYGNREGYADSTLVNFAGTGLSAYEAQATGQDAFKADGDGYFDWKIDLSSNPPRFDGTKTLSWDIAGLLDDFVTGISQNGPTGKTGFSFALHAQGLTNGGSGWFNGSECDTCNPPPPPPPPEVPEPGSLALAGIALLALRKVVKAKAKVGPENEEDDPDDPDDEGPQAR